ncbi:MAG TPA: hypothetical protein VFT67_15020 [Jatrophihabitantaceae bacterium]|nr:hypothetical protein [Jatrophihabitantaceae bacterium]
MNARLRGSVIAAVLAAAAVLLPCLPAAAQQPTPTHVAIVVDGVGTACVPWHSGMTGADVLTARFHVQWGQQTPAGNYAGMVVQINGDPTAPNPHTAYWAYFHNNGSGWQYSGTGALSSHPQPGTVEGWRLDSAATSSHPQPAAASYASVCAGQDPVPAPTPTTTTAPRTHAATHTRTSPAPHVNAARRLATPARSRAAHRSPAAGSAARTTTPAAPRSTVASGAATPVAATPSSTPAAALTRDHGGGFPPWGTALAIVVVLGLGGGALWRTRRHTL